HVYNVDGIDDKLSSISNQDDEGEIFNLFKTRSSCLDDMSSAWLESYGDVSRFNFTLQRPIVMDGFVHTAENFAKLGTGDGTFTEGGCTEADGDCGLRSGLADYPVTSFSDFGYSHVYLYTNLNHAACVPTIGSQQAVGDQSDSFCIDPNHVAPLQQYFNDVAN